MSNDAIKTETNNTTVIIDEVLTKDQIDKKITESGQKADTSCFRYNAHDYIPDKNKTSAKMNELIRTAQANGGGTIVLGDYLYHIDQVIDPDLDGYGTGWLVPYTGQGQEDTAGITFEFSAGTKLYCLGDKMVMIRCSNNFTRIVGSGKSVAPGASTIHIGFVPEDMGQTTQLVSQQFCSVDKNMSFTGGYSAVVTQPGPTVGGMNSGSYYHVFGFNFYNVSYPIWMKQPPKGTLDNLTTTTHIKGVYGNVCVSAGKFEACDAYMQDCAFENMSGEVIEFVEKFDPANKLVNTLKINHCDFEVFKSSDSLGQWGMILGENNKFVTGPVDIPTTLSPNFQYSNRSYNADITQLGKQVFGSYAEVTVQEHIVEHVAGKKDVDQKHMSFIMNKTDGFIAYSESSNYTFTVPQVWYNGPAVWKNNLARMGDKDDAYSGLKTTIGDNWRGIQVVNNSSDSTKTNQYGVVVEFNGDYKRFRPFMYKRDGAESFLIDGDGSIVGTKAFFRVHGTKGWQFTGTKDYSSLRPVGHDGSPDEFNDLRCYGSNDWRVGDQKIFTSGNIIPMEALDYKNGDLNLMPATAGVWRVGDNSTMTNLPAGLSGGNIIQAWKWGYDSALQIGGGSGTNKLMWRNINPLGDKTQPWMDIYHTNNKPTASDVGAIAIGGQSGSVSVRDTRDIASISPYSLEPNTAAFRFTDKEPTPTGDWVGKMSVKGWNENYAAWEIGSSATTYHDGKLWFRSGVGSSWNPWDMVYTTRHKPTPEDIGCISSATPTFNKNITITKGEPVITLNDTDTSGEYAGHIDFMRAPGKGVMILHKDKDLGGLTGYSLAIMRADPNEAVTGAGLEVEGPIYEYGHRRVYSEANPPKLEDLAGDVGFLPTAGGSMTGDINLNDSSVRINAKGLESSPPNDAEFTLYGGQNSAVRYGMNLLSRDGSGSWSTNIFTANQSDRFINFSRLTGEGSSHTHYKSLAYISGDDSNVYVNGSQSSAGNALTRRDYVDTKLPKTGGQVTGSLDTTVDISAGRGLGIKNTSSTSQLGIALYGGAKSNKPEYGILFSGTAGMGKHGGVQSDWATYFTMSDTGNRGWVFQRGTTNVASIDGTGRIYANGEIYAAGNKRVYHEGNKPTPSSIGAFEVKPWIANPGMDANTTGAWCGFTYAENSPVGGPIASFGTQGSNGKYCFQLNSSYNSNELYYRRHNGDNNTWGPWCKIYHSGNKPTLTDLGAVSKSGDTMTGNLTISKVGPKLTLNDTDTVTGTYATLAFNTANNQGVEIIHKEHDSDIPQGGYSLRIQKSSSNAQSFGAKLEVEGEIYELNGNRVYSEGHKPTPDEIGAVPVGGRSGSVTVHDTRNETSITPNALTSNTAAFRFTDKEPTPTGSWVGKMSVKGWADHYAAWELGSSADTSHDGKLWFRSGAGSSWNPWDMVYTTRHKPTAADVGAVNKAGDTMTGTLKTPRLEVISSNPEVMTHWHKPNVIAYSAGVNSDNSFGINQTDGASYLKSMLRITVNNSVISYGDIILKKDGRKHVIFENASGEAIGYLYSDDNGDMTFSRGTKTGSHTVVRYNGLESNNPANEHGAFTAKGVSWGSYDHWMGRTCGLNVSVTDPSNSATVVWKATTWDTSHWACMQVHVPGGFNDVVVQMRAGNNQYNWGGGGFRTKGIIIESDKVTSVEPLLKNRSTTALDIVSGISSNIITRSDDLENTKRISIKPSSVKSALPEAYHEFYDTTESDLTKRANTKTEGIDLGAIVAMQIEAIKELRAEIELLKAKL